MKAYVRDERVASTDTSGWSSLPLVLVAAAITSLAPWLIQLSLYRAVMTALVVIITAGGLGRGCLPGLRPIQVVTFGFAFAYLGVAPIYQLSHRDAAWGDGRLMVLTNPDVDTALILNVVYALTTLIAFELTRQAPPAHSRSDIQPKLRIRLIAPWIFISSAVLLTPGAVAAAGGWGGMFTDRYARAEALADAGITLSDSGGAAVAMVSLLPAALSVASLFLFTLHSISLRQDGSPIPTLQALGLVVALGLSVVHVNPLATGRFLFAMAFGSVLMAVFRPRSGKAGIRFGGLVVLGTLVLYPLANVFRTDDYTFGGALETFASPDFDGFQQTVNAVAFEDTFGHSWGKYLISALGFVIPRAIWQSKAIPASEEVAAFRGYVFTNLSLPVNAELFIEFGILGMIFLVFVASVWLGRMDQLWRHGSWSRLTALVPLVAFAMLGVIRGPLGANGPIYLTVIGLAWIGIRGGSSSKTPINLNYDETETTTGRNDRT